MASTPRRWASARPSAGRIPSPSDSSRLAGSRSSGGGIFPGNAQRIAEEAAALLTAQELEERETAVVLESSQLGLQIHESVGHAIELDRILGLGGRVRRDLTSRMGLLNRHRYGSELMNITADATLPGALGTFGYDDEGTRASRVDIVRDGIWVGVLSGRDSAAIAGLAPGGMVRATDTTGSRWSG